MNVEYTGRQFKVTPAIRKDVETGLTKIRKILGDQFDTKVILTVEKRRHKAEITINPPHGPIVGLAESADMKSAVSQAVEHLEKQVAKSKARQRTRKRNSHDKRTEEIPAEVPAVASKREPSKTAVPLVVHRYPEVAKTTEVHLVASSDAVALRPMTLEEAIKEAHFRDRDVFVFRDRKGTLMILHRTRDGRMELIEAP